MPEIFCGLIIATFVGMGILYFISVAIVGVLTGMAIQRCLVKDDSKKIQDTIDRVDKIIEDIKETV